MTKAYSEMTRAVLDIPRARPMWIAGFAMLALLLTVLAACADDPTATPVPPTATPDAQQELGTIAEIAAGDGRFGTLVAALQSADLVETLSGEGPYTVFAPTDDAFAKLPEGTVESLLADIPALTDILLYHVVAGNVKAADVVALESAATAQGAELSITVNGQAVMVNDARVVITDIEASNGVIHVIDAVLLPPQPVPTPTLAPTATPEPEPQSLTIVDIAAADGRFGTLVAAVQAAGLVETLQGEGPFTVFAPTDDAFAKLPEGTVESLLGDVPALTDVLLYHVMGGEVKAADVATLDSAETVQGGSVAITVEGNAVRVNDATVLITDIEASNGVIHVIDTVLLPPQELGKIEEVAAADGRFGTLVAALQAADLVETLQGEGPFTVFAPTDDAFAKLPAGTVESLLADVPALTGVLLYHVVPGRVTAADVVTLDSAATVQGAEVSIRVDGDAVMVNGAQVIVTDVEASNGVIHVIDSVLLPPQELGTIVDIAVGDGRFGTLVAALQAAELVETLSGPGPFTVFAPTDDAFAKLPDGTVESLLGEIPSLTDVLLYHVVAGDVKAADVVNLGVADTVQGAQIVINVDGDSVMVNDAQVLITDIEASNGVIHVIDTVLLPSTDTGSIVVPPTAGESVQAGSIRGIDSEPVQSELKVL